MAFNGVRWNGIERKAIRHRSKADGSAVQFTGIFRSRQQGKCRRITYEAAQCRHDSRRSRSRPCRQRWLRRPFLQFMHSRRDSSTYEVIAAFIIDRELRTGWYTAPAPGRRVNNKSDHYEESHVDQNDSPAGGILIERRRRRSSITTVLEGTDRSSAGSARRRGETSGPRRYRDPAQENYTRLGAVPPDFAGSGPLFAMLREPEVAEAASVMARWRSPTALVADEREWPAAKAAGVTQVSGEGSRW